MAYKEEDTCMSYEEEEEEYMPADILCVRSISLRRLPCAFDMTPIYTYTYIHIHTHTHTQTQKNTQKQTQTQTDRQTDRHKEF